MAVAAALLLALSACSAGGPSSDPQPGDAGAQPPSSSPVAPAPSESAAPEPTDGAESPESPSGPAPQTGPAPQAILPLTCSGLASSTQVQSGFAASVSPTFTESSAPTSAARADFLQAGGLFCAWGGSGGTGLTVGVIADAASNYAQRIAALTGSGFRDDTLGDDSHVKCTVDGGVAKCVGDVLVGDAWVSAVTTDRGGPSSASGALTAYERVVTPVVAAIRDAGPERGPWSSPTLTGEDGAYFCSSPYPMAELLLAGTNDASVKVASRNTATQNGLMSTRAGSIGCTWKIFTSDAATFTYLPGGAWAFSRMQAAGFATAVPSKFEGSRAVCDADGYCTMYISYSGGLLTARMATQTDLASLPVHLDSLATLLGR